MADNYLEKHYAEYEARKMTYRQGSVRKVHRAMWHISKIVLPSINDITMQNFYVNIFGGEPHNNSVTFDNGLRLEFTPKETDAVICFEVAMVSQYQREQLIRRLSEEGIVIKDGKFCDPSGNEIVIS